MLCPRGARPSDGTEDGRTLQRQRPFRPGWQTRGVHTPGDRDPQGEIDAAIARVELLRPDLDRACDAFLDALSVWVPRWWEEEVRRAIEERPFIVTEDLRTDGVKALKRRVDELKERAPALVRHHLDDPELWIHRRALGDLLERSEQGAAAFVADYTVREVGIQPIEDRVRLVVGSLGPVLLDARLALPHVSSDPDLRRGRWRPAGPSTPPRYMGVLEVPDDIRAPLVEYADRVRDLYHAVADVAKAEHDKAQFLAGQMWDDA